MSTKKYNEIEVKNNMKVEATEMEETVDVPAERKPLQKLVDVQPKKVKRSLFGRLITGIMGPEGLPGIGTYVNEEIVKPAIKNIIFDAITSAASMAMYGDKRGANRVGGHGQYGRGGGAAAYRPNTNYTKRYPNSQSEPRERLVPRAARQYVDEYIIEDRYDASHILATLAENADRYDTVSVADYYDLIGVDSKYTDNNHGWTVDSINRASVVPVNGGYVIKFPPVEVI